ncbi:MAG: hypothetical protein IPI19_12085 [Ignavibacteriales bacterium]|nr:hypothetical protein [Ignavibacteriales bacterium]
MIKFSHLCLLFGFYDLAYPRAGVLWILVARVGNILLSISDKEFLERYEND